MHSCHGLSFESPTVICALLLDRDYPPARSFGYANLESHRTVTKISSNSTPRSHRLLGLHHPCIIHTGIVSSHPSNVERCGLTRVRGIILVLSNCNVRLDGHNKFDVFLDPERSINFFLLCLRKEILQRSIYIPKSLLFRRRMSTSRTSLR